MGKERERKKIFELAFPNDKGVKFGAGVIFLKRSFGTKKKGGEGRSRLFFIFCSSSELVLLNV